MTKTILLLTIMVLLSGCDQSLQFVYAGEYEINNGKGTAVCEAYLENLNSFQPKSPMVCGRPINQKWKDFTTPDWVTYRDGRRLTRKMTIIAYNAFSEFVWERDVNPVLYYRKDKWSEWKGTKDQLQEARKNYEVDRESRWINGAIPFIAELDIDNDGNNEQVYYEKNCGSVYGDLFAVLTSDYKSIDREKTERIYQHSPFKQMNSGVFRPVKKGDWGIPPSDIGVGYAPTEGAFTNLHYGIFLYKGTAYYDQWWTNHPEFQGKSDIDKGLLKIFRASEANSKEVCSYKFVSK